MPRVTAVADVVERQPGFATGQPWATTPAQDERAKV